MKKYIALAVCLVSVDALAQNKAPAKKDTPQQARVSAAVSAQILDVATAYARAIACSDALGADQDDIIALSKSEDDEARYAVVWAGDIGCNGGSGTVTSNITLVHFGGTGGAHAYVNSAHSSPVIEFDSGMRYVEKVQAGPKGSLIVKGVTWGKDDPQCCPSLPVTATLFVDKKGNWRPAAAVK